MKIFTSNNLVKLLEGKEFYLDCDFLNLIFRNPSVLQKLLPSFTKGYPLIEGLVAFEFIRDLYIQKEIDLRAQFLKNDFFLPTVNHQTIFLQTQQNASILSRIYSHNKCNGASLVDLMLSARVMVARQSNPYIVTGNKKDYPICIFDTREIINIENDKNGKISTFSILEFSRNKFDQAFSSMQKAH